MDKPIKPKRPKKPNKVNNISTVRHTYYEIATDYSTNPASFKLIKPDANGDFNYEDDSPGSSIKLLDLVRLLEINFLKPEYVTIDAVNEGRDSYTAIGFTYSEPVDLNTVVTAQQAAEQKYNEGMVAYNQAMVNYPSELAEYKVKLAEYEVWQANQKLRKVRESRT